MTLKILTYGNKTTLDKINNIALCFQSTKEHINKKSWIILIWITEFIHHNFTLLKSVNIIQAYNYSVLNYGEEI